MQRREEQHNTPEQAHHYLQQTLVIIDEADVPEDLREAAFAKVYDSVASKQIFFEQVAPLPNLGNLRH